jgi:hypothetical protein
MQYNKHATVLCRALRLLSGTEDLIKGVPASDFRNARHGSRKDLDAARRVHGRVRRYGFTLHYPAGTAFRTIHLVPF